MLQSLFPKHLSNNGYRGRAAALWLFAVFLALKAIMGVNGAINTRAIATGDGIRLDGLDEGAAETILLLFRSLSIAQLPLVAIGVAVLLRWRSMVPFILLVLVADQMVRHAPALWNAVGAGRALSVGMWINLAFLGLLLVSLMMSLWGRPGEASQAPAAES